jgi:hypothetical protein
MELKQLYAYAIVFVALVVLLVIAVSDYYSIGSMGGQLDTYKQQQQEYSGIIASQYANDMNAAVQAWGTANTQENVSLQDQGITVEADTIETQTFTMVLDLQAPAATSISMGPGNVDPGDVLVYLGEYYQANMTRVPGWISSYEVNTTTHTVVGLTPMVIESIANEYYSNELAPTMDQVLGVSAGTITGTEQRTIDCSYLSDSDTWLYVSEYKYILRNTQLAPYVLIKTYVNATSQQVTSDDISPPYYDSVTGFDY